MVRIITVGFSNGSVILVISLPCGGAVHHCRLIIGFVKSDNGCKIHNTLETEASPQLHDGQDKRPVFSFRVPLDSFFPQRFQNSFVYKAVRAG